MTTTAVPSKLPEDFALNIDNLDKFSNSTSPTFIDRLGISKRTLAGVDAEAEARMNANDGTEAAALAVRESLSTTQRNNFQSAADLVLAGAGYAPPVAYTAGLSMTLPVQTVNYLGQTYAPILSALPFTTSGAFETAKFRLIQGVAAVDLAAAGGAGMVGTKAIGAGAEDRTVEDKLRETCTPLGYMTQAMRDDVTSGTLAMDHTAAVQASLNTGKTVDLLGLAFKVNNLMQAFSNQGIVSSQGVARLIKNSNGPILTSTGSDLHMENVNWRGDAAAPLFTGDGVISTGSRPSFINCGGRWISGRPLKATGSRVKVKGTCDIYQTTDASAAGYDIEIGQSGVATLYHELDEIYTSQKSGGILLIDTGSHTIKGGLFGKLSISAGTKPAGCNGGKTIGARILGNVTVAQSSAIFSSNQFSAVNVAFLLGTSGCRLDASNVFEVSATVTNAGNGNNIVVRDGSGGSGLALKFGDDVSLAVLGINTLDRTQQWNFSGSTVLPNTRGYKGTTAAGVLADLATCSAGDVATYGSLSWSRISIFGPSIDLSTASGTQVQVLDGVVRPWSDNNKQLGTASLRWSSAYITSLRPGAGAATWTSGSGSPEGSLPAAVGSLYTRTDGASLTTLYVKESGTGNTGWIAK